MISSYWKTFLNILYPPKCPYCKTLVQEHGAWCSSCLSAIFAVREINVLEHRLKALDSCRVVCEYTGGLKRIIHDMKFRQQKKYGIHLNWLLTNSKLAHTFSTIEYVIPVPLHTARLRERGYNQTEVIFKKWSKKENLQWMPELLVRGKHTIPQWELTLAKRKENLKGAFVITRPLLVKDKHILLVDDIITTGITLDECAKVLKESGAASVHGLAIASGAR
ncbi:ComF family protein [Pelosinus fermentans]|uniref:Phosphoribosyltransferase n=1 Tax=Pelosinus fermentans JBW45 TaxID=1192197 RepID=I8TS58_9FIRM|nr:ComF family protein [Pelosinus fermentans]AJQ26064.1 phosphoribosyltransferase [Pelosinus fermentans JBW45]